MPDKFLRPTWDDWFMTMAFVVAQRSLDPHTKCGCVVVDAEKNILSVGYNSPPRGCDDENIPLTRPEKYAYMEHAESNAINNAARNGIRLKGSTLYVTAPPCHACWRRIINVGTVKVIYGPSKTSMTDDTEQLAIIERLLAEQKIEVVAFTDISVTTNIGLLLDNTWSYIQRKINE